MTSVRKTLSDSLISTHPREGDLNQQHDKKGACQEAFRRLSTGVSGLDEILCEGLIPQRAYLLRGGPGCGKTTLGLHFLAAGAANAEPCLLISLGESEEGIRANAEAIGFDLSNISILDLSPNPEFFTQVEWIEQPIKER